MLRKENLFPLSGFEPTKIQSVEMGYTDHTISTRHFWTSEDENNLMCIRETSDIQSIIPF